ncbi:helix-turn-helix domain-containing protein [Heyndrickxia coagulans]|uniref:helix-turn-helix domain-containing protein n=1 Tax=Heyndrickxia coagulans TaxID=1398 RepID=UPI00145990F3|nr:helix-turn-helix domain-containing protein [Heyndrickxia coagulans]NMH83283.1 helix-turn-helix domain-containing protein [Heyndrickxia coagulans]
MAKGKYQEWLTPENLTLLEGWARDGLTDEQIAENIGIRRETLYDWKKRYPNISNALKRGKEVIDRQVENALLKRAIGYEYEEETQEYIPELDRMVVTKRVKKKQAPDVTAQIFWLKNRRPDKWRDKQDFEHSGTIKNDIDMSGLSIEELRKLAELDE